MPREIYCIQSTVPTKRNNQTKKHKTTKDRISNASTGREIIVPSEILHDIDLTMLAKSIQTKRKIPNGFDRADN